jgi:hypothetical protein
MSVKFGSNPIDREGKGRDRRRLEGTLRRPSMMIPFHPGFVKEHGQDIERTLSRSVRRLLAILPASPSQSARFRNRWAFPIGTAIKLSTPATNAK